jgi:hypothetical protein
MDEISGWTAIDTLYEVKGLQVASGYFVPLFALAAGVLVTTGIVRCLYRTTETNRYRELAVYLLLALTVAWLIHPTSVRVAAPAGYTYDATLEEMVEDSRGGQAATVTVAGVPMILPFLHEVAEFIPRIMSRAIDRGFETNPFGHDRGAALLRLSRVRDDDALRTRFHGFLGFCYLPALARLEKEGKPAPAPYYDPFRIPLPEYALHKSPDVDVGEVTIPGKPCSEYATALYQDLIRNVQANHTDTLQAVHDVLEKKGGFGVKPGQVQHVRVVEIVLRYVLHNETRGVLSTNEVAALRRALPDYEMFDRKTQTSGNSQDAVDYIRTTVSWLVKIKQSVDQWINHHAEGPANYFKAVSYGPGCYGITQMILLALFPIVAFVALLPGAWKALVLWFQVFLSVKLWLVFWALLSRFNEYRYSLEDIGSGPENGIGDQSYLFPAIAAMYLMTPLLSGLVVYFLSAAGKRAGAALSSFVGPSAHSDLGRQVSNKGMQLADAGLDLATGGTATPATAAAEAGTSGADAGGTPASDFWEGQLAGQGAPAGATGPAGGGAPAEAPPPVPA